MIQNDSFSLKIKNIRMYASLREHQFLLYEDYARMRYIQG